jgi:hypothetical protein
MAKQFSDTVEEVPEADLLEQQVPVDDTEDVVDEQLLDEQAELDLPPRLDLQDREADEGDLVEQARAVRSGDDYPYGPTEE